MNAEEHVRVVSELVGASRFGDQIYAVIIVYPESEEESAGGLILRRAWIATGTTTRC